MRVNVETRAIRDSRRLSRRLKMSQAEALGRLVFLWESSQDAEVFECTSEDVICWFFPDLDTRQTNTHIVIKALEECGFVKTTEKNTVQICGNDKHIEYLTSQRKRASKGGKARQKKINQDSSRRLKPRAKQKASPGPQPNTIQSNTIQSNASKNLSEGRGSIERAEPAEKKKSSFNEYITQYVTIWKKHNPGTRPSMMGKEQGILKRLSKDLTSDQFATLYDVYLQMKEPWFEKKQWDMATFEQNIHKVGIAAQRGMDSSDPLHKFLEKQKNKLEEKNAKPIAK